MGGGCHQHVGKCVPFVGGVPSGEVRGLSSKIHLTIVERAALSGVEHDYAIMSLAIQI